MASNALSLLGIVKFISGITAGWFLFWLVIYLRSRGQNGLWSCPQGHSPQPFRLARELLTWRPLPCEHCGQTRTGPTLKGRFILYLLWGVMALRLDATAVLQLGAGLTLLYLIAAEDLHNGLIPDPTVALLFILALSERYFLNHAWREGFNGVLGLGALLLVVLGSLWLIKKRLTMGWGDIKFILVLGFWLGLVPGLLILFIAGLSAVGQALWQVVKTRQLPETLPFGPHLAWSTALFLTWQTLQPNYLDILFTL